MRHIVCAVIMLGALQAAPALAQPVQLHSLDDALRIGEENSPRLRSAEARIAGALGERQQAEALPNPELFVDSEGFGGTKTYQGSRSMEVAAGIAQRIELGGKRQARIGLAETGQVLAAQDKEAELLALRDDIARAFVQGLYAARLTELEQDRLTNSRALAAAVRERVQNGREPAIQERKTDITLAAAELASQKARREYLAATVQLEALLGTGPLEMTAGRDWFERVGAVPEVRSGDEALQGNPDYLRVRGLIEQARAAVAKEQSLGVPDVTLRAGIRRYNEDDSSAFLVGVSIPIPVFDQNRGNISRARSDLTRAEADAQAMRLLLLGNLGRARQAILAAYGEVQAMRGTITPAADQSLAAAREAYGAGKLGFLDLLDAQRTQFDVQAQLAAALRDYHLARIDLMRLVGRTY